MKMNRSMMITVEYFYVTDEVTERRYFFLVHLTFDVDNTRLRKEIDLQNLHEYRSRL